MPHKDPAVRRAYAQAHYRAHKMLYIVRAATWKAKNPAKVRASRHTFYITHAETLRAYQVQRYAENPSHVAAINAAWEQAHPEKRQAKYQRRRAALLHAPQNDFTGEQWRALKKATGQRCVYCGRHMERLTMDHVIPLCAGGAHTLSNIVPACKSCNSRKGKGMAPKQIIPLAWDSGFEPQQEDL